ncbi:biotin/lipoyl-containing protein [candidate division CSSED10-310 bacterium]|uniref:Biotin/lipoyl-containing protein n=1 Tax=candidate division CSSED10-310 bacterium TaxID=2855610 RepID=A0ABV6YVM5_UNCC1
MSTYFLIDKSESDQSQKKIEVKKDNDTFLVTINGQQYAYDVVLLSENKYSIINQYHSHNVTIVPQDDSLLVEIGSERYELCLVDQHHFQKRKSRTQQKKDGALEIKAPMPGKVVDVLVTLNQSVEENEGLMIIEAMKMENEIKSPVKGKVKEIKVKPGDTVDSMKVILILS